MNTANLHRRAKAIRSRAAIRAWEYRQRHLAHGVWFRFRSVLAHAREAWAIGADDARRLLEEGVQPEQVGFELDPPKTILFLSPARVDEITAKQSMPIRLGPDMLAARHVALVAW